MFNSMGIEFSLSCFKTRSSKLGRISMGHESLLASSSFKAIDYERRVDDILKSLNATMIVMTAAKMETQMLMNCF